MNSNLPSPDSNSLYPSLPYEIYPRDSYHLVGKLIISIILLFFLFNVVYYFYLNQYDSSRETRKIELVNLLDEPVDVIILGDSVSDFGIIPNLIESETGYTALNLALNGSWTYYHDVWILESYIRKFGPPKFIIWGHAHHVVERTFNSVVRLSSTTHPYGFGWSSEYLDPIMSDFDKIQIIIHRLFPLYYRDQTNKYLLSHLLSVQDSDMKYDIKNKGVSFFPVVDEEIVETKVQNAMDSISGRFFIADDNRRVIRILLDMLEEYQIPTYSFIAPVHQTLGSNEDYLFALRPQKKWLNARSLEYDMLTFNPEIIMYESSYMVDEEHMNINGAELFTHYLIDWIWGDYMPMTFAETMGDSE